MPAEDLLVPKEAAAELHVTRRTLRRYVKAGRLRAIRPSGQPKGRMLIPRSEIERVLAAGEAA
jgi:excisionase family DNA binding protein